MAKRNQRHRIMVEPNVNEVGRHRSDNLKWSVSGFKEETEKIIFKRRKSTNNANMPAAQKTEVFHDCKIGI